MKSITCYQLINCGDIVATYQTRAEAESDKRGFRVIEQTFTVGDIVTMSHNNGGVIAQIESITLDGSDVWIGFTDRNKATIGWLRKRIVSDTLTFADLDRDLPRYYFSRNRTSSPKSNFIAEQIGLWLIEASGEFTAYATHNLYEDADGGVLLGRFTTTKSENIVRVERIA